MSQISFLNVVVTGREWVETSDAFTTSRGEGDPPVATGTYRQRSRTTTVLIKLREQTGTHLKRDAVAKIVITPETDFGFPDTTAARSIHDVIRA